MLIVSTLENIGDDKGQVLTGNSGFGIGYIDNSLQDPLLSLSRQFHSELLKVFQERGPSTHLAQRVTVFATKTLRIKGGLI